MEFKASVEKRDNGTVVVKLNGSLDSDTYRDFEVELKPVLVPETKVLIFDMSGLNYISSAGIGVIFNAMKLIKSHKGIALMTDLQPQVKTVFDIIKALPKQSIFESMEEADHYLSVIQGEEMKKRRNL